MPTLPNTDGTEAYNAAGRFPCTAGIIDEQHVTEIYEHRQRRIWDHLKIDLARRAPLEPCHVDPATADRPRGDRDIHRMTSDMHRLDEHATML
ncbi:hypothetical protein AB0C34_21420 [Nocardia sp. NPDC049220]|uniref:hypothetical protein n=1 Tax=Nocardia sp. NPDC049220 TaxID=3155273 RepID=UPI00340FF18A